MLRMRKASEAYDDLYEAAQQLICFFMRPDEVT